MSKKLNNKWKLQKLIPLVEKDNSDYQYDEQELKEYAQHIGIQLPEQQYMLFVAEEGMKENLPKGWKAFLTPQQQPQVVYLNMENGEIFEEHPLDKQYRVKIMMLRQEILSQQQQQNSQYSESAQLSEIAEEQNQIGNDSEIYQRKKPSIPRQSNLRQPLTKEGIKIITETHKRQISKLSENSAIERNIWEKNDNTVKQGDTRIRSSSLLQVYKSAASPLQDQYGTQFTQKDYESKEQQSQGSSLGNQLKDQINRVKELKQRLFELQEQEKLKLALLENLEKSNNHLLQKIYKRINHKRKGKKHTKA